MPASIFIQSGETGYPEVVAIIHPCVGFWQFAIYGKSSHCKDAESHLPYMVVGNMVLQSVIEISEHFAAVYFYGIQQHFAGVGIKQIV